MISSLPVDNFREQRQRTVMVRVVIGRLAGQEVEMPFLVAERAIASGSAERILQARPVMTDSRTAKGKS